MTTGICIQLIAALALLPLTLHAQDERIDPKHPEVKYLTEYGTMKTTGYGRELNALGDIDRDGLADWCVSRNNGYINDKPRIDLLVHKGMKGKLPSVDSGQRVGPTELASQTRFHAAGDWDGDGYIDIAAKIYIIGDTTGAAGGTVWTVSRLVIFWGNSQGNFSINDTTRLERNSVMWLGIGGHGYSRDWDGDEVDDLLVEGNSGMTDGQVIQGPRLAIFRGHRGGRWGRGSIGRRADWSWWTPPTFSHKGIASLDADCDRAPDLVLYYEEKGVWTPGSVSVLYGIPSKLPDTTNVQTLGLGPVKGHTGLLTDITGDGVAELLVTTMEELIKVYAGEPGVRLLEQFGSGNDEPDVEHGRWYRRPWAEISLPRHLNDGWPLGGQQPLFALGDAGLDDYNDVWAYVPPWIVAYNTGEQGGMLDSLIDAIITPLGNDLYDVVVLGDIDGSGIPTIGIAASPSNAIQFIKPSKDVPETAVPRQPLHPAGIRCAGVAGVEPHNGATGADKPQLDVVPNPSTGEVHVRWQMMAPHGVADIVISDVQGREVATFNNIPISHQSLIWDASTLPDGRYIVTLTIGARTISTQLQLAK